MKNQRGGLLIGLIVGLLAGLAIALGVALYVTKVPVPFINKVPQRTAEQDAAEVEKNKNWDPNSPLYGKNPAKPQAVTPAASPLGDAPAMGAPAVPPTLPPPLASSTASAPAPRPRASAPSSTRDPAAILADRPASSAAGLVVSTQPGADAFRYFVQAGAYASPDEAEQQRAKLGLLGFLGRVTEREQAGRTMYRVRLGPYDRKDDADQAKDRLDSAGVEAALVRVQK